MIERSGLTIDAGLVRFIEERALPGSGIAAERFWAGTSQIFAEFADENAQLLAERDRLQSEIDRWHSERAGSGFDVADYETFLRAIGYLVDEPPPFVIDPAGVDAEIASTAGPQLVVPVMNARFLLNAANARWGSLYDALYGTDAVEGTVRAGGYDFERGNAVIERAKVFLDAALPLAEGSWADATDPLQRLADPSQFVGLANGNPLFRHNGLHIELVVDRNHPVGYDDPAGIADVLLESAVTTIVDFEDSTAAVDAEDKVAAYANWLGVMKGDLSAKIDKDGRVFSRSLAEDKMYMAPGGEAKNLPGRSLLLVRNVGHLMTTPAVLLADGREAPEGILDAIVTSLIACHDLRGKGRFRNSREGSVYIVKPKMHGPSEVSFTNRLFDAVEDLLDLDRFTLKVGLMDEERRTSANLAACIHAIRNRIVFINTGFLDRTGDEIHTSMHAGPMIPKGEMKASGWIRAYEDRNVQIGLACGLSGKAQIGKGMWAAPDRMADMVEQKIGHPLAGASTAWVPSPTAAVLHAMHYHLVDVFGRQKERRSEPVAPLSQLLTIPTGRTDNLSKDEIRLELENNCQGILGYVVRWIDQGIGCSKVPDINDVGLMEDRATLRIASQAIANWLLHGICSANEVNQAFERMAEKVDAQNSGDRNYRPLSGNPDGPAFRAARSLVFDGVAQPNGYTEPLLHRFRAEAKALAGA